MHSNNNIVLWKLLSSQLLLIDRNSAIAFDQWFSDSLFQVSFNGDVSQMALSSALSHMCKMFPLESSSSRTDDPKVCESKPSRMCFLADKKKHSWNICCNSLKSPSTVAIKHKTNFRYGKNFKRWLFLSSLKDTSLWIYSVTKKIEP